MPFMFLYIRFAFDVTNERKIFDLEIGKEIL